MSRILICFFLIIIVPVYGQGLIASYWQQINKAELNICKRNYPEAVKLYRSAFLLDTVMVDPIDLYNASVCCVYVEDFMFAQECMLRLVGAGFDFNFFLRKHAFKRFRESGNWLIFVDKYPQSRLLYLQNLDVTQKVVLEHLFFEDQHLRSLQTKDQLEYHGKNLDISLDTIIKYDSLLCDETLEFIKKYGFPPSGEGNIYTVQDTNILLYDMYELVFHGYLRDCSGFTETLLPHLLVGRIRPELFWSWYNYEVSRKGDLEYGPTSTFIVMNGQPFVEKYDSSKNEIFNHKRSELFLPSIEDERKKISYSKLLLIPSDFIISPFVTNKTISGLSTKEVEFMRPVLQEVNYYDFIDE
jgi:hypothetical protein